MMNQSIYQIFSLNSGHIILVYENGSIELLTSSESFKGQLSANDKLKWCWAGSNDQELFLFLVTENQSQWTIWTYQYSLENSTWHSNSVMLPDTEGSLLTCCCSVNTQNRVTFYTFWSTKYVFRTDLTLQSLLYTKKLYFLSSVSDKSTSMLTLDANHFAIVPVKTDNQEGVGIFDAHFGTMTAWQPIPHSIFSQPKLFSSNGHLFTACDKDLLAYSYHLESSTLSNLMCNTYQLAHDQNLLRVVPMHTKWDVHSTYSDEKVSDEEAIQNLFTKLFDFQQKSCQSSFQSHLDKLFQILSQEQNQHWWASVHMIKLIVTSCNKDDLLSIKQFTTLIESGSLPLQCLPDLINSLIKKKEPSLVDLAVKKLSDIPEICLANIIKFYLSIDELSNGEQQLENNHEEMEVDKPEDSATFERCPLNQQTAAYLCQLLSYPFSDVYLSHAMKTLPFKYAVILLKFLNYQLLEASILPKSDVSTPAVTKIVDWISATVDAHVLQMVISPDTKQLLSILYNTIEKRVEFVDQLASIEAYLTQMNRKNILLNKKQDIGQYCIRTLHIP
ncbi:Hypothetical predicted protein [Octopus vulgaris]|uniref:Nucleolar protein 11 n=2 Tax=Octopus TaxID=6643 RepID=A0AA36F6Q1_OCTVU|nr:Hypothetical predicted protein [Octopus vulgaris]